MTFGAGPLTCGNFVRAVDGLDPRDKDSPKVTFTNYKRFVTGWLTAADRFIPGLNDATGGRDADWFTGVLVNHPRQSVFDDCRCIGTDHQYPVSTTFRRKGPARNVSQHCNEQYARQTASR